MGVQPKKSLGQNFLHDRNVIDKIIYEAKSGAPKKIFEIGPGLGSLTNDLAALTDNLCLIELDSAFAQRWREKNFNVIEADALRVDWQNLIGSVESTLVSNLPYQISASIVIELSPNLPNLKKMVLMFQKEVAQRLMAQPKTKDYGFLSVVAQEFWQLKKVCEAGPTCFYPAPQISSRVMCFIRKPESKGMNTGFIKFVKLCFSQRRKQLKKRLVASSGFKAEKIDQVWDFFHLDSQVRAEEIAASTFLQMYDQLSQ